MSAPLRVSQVLEKVNKQCVSKPFICKPISSELTPHPPPLLGSVSPLNYLPALVTSQPGTRHRGTASVPQSQPKFFNPANPKLVYPDLPAETTRKPLDHCVPISPCLLTNPSAAGGVVGHLGSASIINHLSMAVVSDLSASPHLNRNKTCMIRWVLPSRVLVISSSLSPD